MSDQYVIVRDGKRNGSVRIYTTVYDDHEATRQTARCRQRHGIHCGARALRAKDAKLLPQDRDA